MFAPVALTIAGSDNSAGAGIQADLKTFTHFRVYGQTVVTCVVAEVPSKVSRIQPVDLEVIRDQLSLSLEYFPVSAIKTGMLFSAEIVDLVCAAIQSQPEARRPALVVDPVMAAGSGDPLLQSGARERYQDRLFPLASVVTPNLDEAELLLETRIPTVEALHGAAVELARRHGVPFLVKGGHLPGASAVDWLVAEGHAIRISGPYHTNVSTHGTGCTFSAALAANLALGKDLEEAAGAAKTYVTRAISTSLRWVGNRGEISALNPWVGGASDL
jgi:hydroxymethylpyrimidine/phosphomethylpyrimidine kinase